jgi:hypothetical protein
MMRSRAVLTVAAVTVVAVVPAGSAHAATEKRCAMKGTKTVAKNRYARVFTRPSRGGDEVERLYGCLYSVNRRVWLDTSSDDEYVTSEEFSDVVLDGRIVSWKHTSTDISCKADCPPGYDGTTETMRRADLRTRKVTTGP